VIGAFVLTVALAATPAPGAPAASDAPQVLARAAKTDVTVGEAFAVDVAGTGPAGITWTFPEDAGNDQVELRTVIEPQGAPAALPGVHRYQATVFAVGDVAVPAIPVKYRLADGTEGGVATAAVPLRIVSLLPKGEGNEPKLVDIRGPGAVSIGRVFWIALAVAALLVAAMVGLFLKRRRRAEAPTAARPADPPDVDALRALDALGQSGLLERGEARAFYIELVAIVKGYLERRLEAPLLEMTSQEAGVFLKGHPEAAPLASAFREMCGAADQVKFARGGAVVEEGQRHLTGARSLVSTLESRMYAAAQAASAQGASAQAPGTGAAQAGATTKAPGRVA